jgi:coenzyme F420 hydrogenase subunit beta
LPTCSFFSSNKGFGDGLIGNYISCYIGYSTDKTTRLKASSGGLVSSLLILCLEEGLVDGAVVTRMSKNNPLAPDVFIARSRDEILSACGSKYCPVSINSVVEDLLKDPGRYAVVGLPCHIHSVKRIECLNRESKKQVVLHLGLFCSHTVNFVGTEILLKKIGVKIEDVTELEYRRGGWPGNLLVKLKNGRTKSLPYSVYWGSLFSPFFFTPMGCMLCSDATNELADISFGDAWLPEIRRKDSVGTSVVISRTRKGEEFLRKMKSKGIIELEEIGENEIVKSHWASLVFKKKTLMERMLILNFVKRNPLRKRTKTSALGFACALAQLLNAHLSARRDFQALITHAPYQVLKMYSLIVAGLHYLCWKMVE